MRSRFDELFTRGWKPVVPAPAVEPVTPAPVAAGGVDVAGQARRLPREVFEALEARIREDLGNRVAGLEPLLDQARRLMAALFPLEHPSEVQGAAREKAHQELAGALDQVEDLYQALQLVKPAR